MSAYPPWSSGREAGAVTGDEAGDEGAVPGVVVRRLLLVDEVLPPDDAAAAEVGGGGDAGVEHRDAHAGAGRAAVGRRHYRVEADCEVGDVEGADVVEPEDRVVGDDEADGVALGERVDLVLGQICGDCVERGERGRLHARGHHVLHGVGLARHGEDDHGHRAVAPGGVEHRRDAVVDLRLGALIGGQCR